MINIAIGVEAFEAVAVTLPHANVGYENDTNQRGERLIWLPRTVLDQLNFLRGPSESSSDIILRIAKSEGECTR
jgi:hypothetical protein